MHSLRRNRFPVVFLALLVFCSAMVVRQFAANKSKHIKLRDEFIEQYRQGYREDAWKLYERLLRDLQVLPEQTLKDDLRRMSALVNPTNQQSENLIWRYQRTVSNEIEKRSP
jgi:hypothetical protein